jgi:uncharacterized protein YeeX (DUF496 family)
LSERGVDGEKDTAERLLKKLKEKYRIEDEIEEPEIFSFTCATKWERRLLQQCYYAFRNGDLEWKIWNNGKNYLLEMTATEYLQFNEMYKHYVMVWRKMQEDFYSAFIQAHMIYPADRSKSINLDELSVEVRAEHERVSKIAKNIEANTFHLKIGSGQ